MSSAHASLGAYALDALDDGEALDVEHHLAECEACRREFDVFGETAAELTRLVASAPPAAVRSSVLRSIDRIRPLPPQTEAEKSAAAGNDSAGRRAVSVPARPARPVSRWLVGLVAASLFAAVGAGGWAVHSRQQVLAGRQAQVQAGRQADLTRTETAILQAPDAAVYPARLQDGSTVSYLVARSQNAAMLISGGLGDPGPGRSYQLWTLTRGSDGEVRYVPDHTFTGGRDQRVIVTGDVTAAVGVAVTVEPAGGSLQPTEEPDARATF